ncbi:hypothetical protein HORIV_11520 [Vreelandella olivaria]|uniref:Amino-acid acetyltransferase n=1 Tax=Vreelandella olivaria TaxID=390919 RepID=A0ABN5WP26_9GAMM|nr:hypothetical protein HORIV_11520 [Halomonas olivaria]
MAQPRCPAGELFTRDGVGTMITQHRYEQLRPATLNDVAGLLELLEPLERRGMLVARSRERLEHEIDDYMVIERDGMVIGCAALHVFTDTSIAELACVAVHDNYRGGERGERLVEAYGAPRPPARLNGNIRADHPHRPLVC